MRARDSEEVARVRVRIPAGRALPEQRLARLPVQRLVRVQGRGLRQAVQVSEALPESVVRPVRFAPQSVLVLVLQLE